MYSICIFVSDLLSFRRPHRPKGFGTSHHLAPQIQLGLTSASSHATRSWADPEALSSSHQFFWLCFLFFFFLTTQKNKDLEEGCKLPVHLGHTFLGTVLPTLGIPSCLRVEAVGDCG